MLPEIELFVSWLRRKSPQSSTAVHYGSDLKLFFAWIGKPYADVKVQEMFQLVGHLEMPELYYEERLGIASQLREVLSRVNEHAPPMFLARAMTVSKKTTR
jgi:hypothetical protein